MPLAKNTAHDVPFAFVSAIDGSSLTGASVFAFRCLDGGPQADAEGSVIELAEGQYLFQGAAADFNADFTTGLVFRARDAIPVHVLFQMQYFRGATAYRLPFLLINASTGIALEGAMPSGLRCLDGQSQEAVSGTFVERGNGQYVFEATAEDFSAEDIAGFLITAPGAVPVHLIIDLLESYSPSPAVGDNPAAILASYITGLGLMTVPSAAGQWPLYVSHFPDSPNNAGAIYNTTPVIDGTLQPGDTVQHYGIQISVRASDEETGWDKCNVIAGQLDAVNNAQTVHDGTTYTIHSVTRVGGVNSLGAEPGTKRRRAFSMNFLVSISQL